MTARSAQTQRAGRRAARGSGAAGNQAAIPRSAMLRAAGLVLAVALCGAQPMVLPIALNMAAAQASTAQADYPTAADALFENASRLPYSGYAQNRAGLASISAQRWDDAIKYLNAAARLDGWTPQRRIALGDAFYGKGDLPAALEQWEAAWVDLPEDDGLLVRLARNYEAVGRYPEAVTALNALARLRGDDATVYYRLAVLTAATVPAEAPGRLAVVAELSPELAPLTQLLINAIQEGQATGSEAVTYAKVGFAFETLGEWRLAEEALTRAVTLDPTYGEAYAYLGLALDQQGKDGLESYEQALALEPASMIANFYVGLYWRRFGDSEQALTYLNAAFATDPTNPAIAAEMGAAYGALGDLINAEKWLSAAVTLDESDARWWLLLARFCVDNDYHVAELGLPAARQAATMAPDDPGAADTLGFALVLTGDLVNAQKVLERALALDPQSPSIYYHLGEMYARQGDTAQAEAALNHALALDPDGFYGGLALQALARLGQ
jgi:tetratricopeptide (TPR) repeat protein